MAATAKVSSKLRYTDHPAFAAHTPAQWVEIVNHAILIRDAYTGPRTNMVAHINGVIAGARAPAPVLANPDNSAMEIKFFPRDVVGKQPAKAGAAFKAQFFGGLRNFRAVSLHGDFFMAVMA